MKDTLLPALLLLGLIAGCDVVGCARHASQQYVVEGYLVAGEGWQSVRVSRTMGSLQSRYSYEKLDVSGADVRVDKLDGSGNVTATYPYRENAVRSESAVPDSSTSSIYLPVRPDAPVEPLGTYRLHVEIPPKEGGPHTITATTTVPDTFSVRQASSDTVTYQSDEQVQLTLTRSRYPRRESRLVFSSKALGNPLEGRVTPLLAKILCEQENPNLNDIRLTTSPVVNESNPNYQPHPDGSVTVTVPWLVFSFYGPNQLGARALSDSYYDYLRSYSAQQGSPTLAPGELPNVIDNVKGGTGLFGSYARISSYLFLRKPPDEETSVPDGCRLS